MVFWFVRDFIINNIAQAEVGLRGPIACGMCVTPLFEAYSGGIFEDKTNCTGISTNHSQK